MDAWAIHCKPRETGNVVKFEETGGGIRLKFHGIGRPADKAKEDTLFPCISLMRADARDDRR